MTSREPSKKQRVNLDDAHHFRHALHHVRAGKQPAGMVDDIREGAAGTRLFEDFIGDQRDRFRIVQGIPRSRRLRAISAAAKTMIRSISFGVNDNLAGYLSNVSSRESSSG